MCDGDGRAVHLWENSALQAPRMLEIIVQAMTNELGHLRRNFVGDDGYQAFAAESDDGQRERVIARENHKIFRQVAEHGGDLTDVARSLLDSDDVVEYR